MTQKENQMKRYLVNRDLRDKTPLWKLQAYKIAATTNFEEHEPEDVTQARNEIHTWKQTIDDFNCRGMACTIPCRIYYALQVSN